MAQYEYFTTINQIVEELVEQPEKFDDDALQDVAGVLLDLNIYAQQLHNKLTGAYIQIAIQKVKATHATLTFSPN